MNPNPDVQYPQRRLEQRRGSDKYMTRGVCSDLGEVSRAVTAWPAQATPGWTFKVYLKTDDGYVLMAAAQKSRLGISNSLRGVCCVLKEKQKGIWLA